MHSKLEFHQIEKESLCRVWSVSQIFVRIDNFETGRTSGGLQLS
jgi:hypothetical protein